MPCPPWSMRNFKSKMRVMFPSHLLTHLRMREVNQYAQTCYPVTLLVNFENKHRCCLYIGLVENLKSYITKWLQMSMHAVIASMTQPFLNIRWPSGPNKTVLTWMVFFGMWTVLIVILSPVCPPGRITKAELTSSWRSFLETTKKNLQDLSDESEGELLKGT